MEANGEPDLRQLENATSRHAQSKAASDAETVELCEGWTLLVRLLEEADQGTVMPELAVKRDVRDSPLRVGRLALIAALAASLLIALTVTWHLVRRLERPVAETTAGGSARPVQENVVAERPDAVPLAESAIDTAWDDDLDGSLEQLKQQIASFHGSGYLADSPYSVLDARIESLQEKLNEL